MSAEFTDYTHSICPRNETKLRQRKNSAGPRFPTPTDTTSPPSVSRASQLNLDSKISQDRVLVFGATFLATGIMMAVSVLRTLHSLLPCFEPSPLGLFSYPFSDIDTIRLTASATSSIAQRVIPNNKAGWNGWWRDGKLAGSISRCLSFFY